MDIHKYIINSDVTKKQQLQFKFQTNLIFSSQLIFKTILME